MQGDSIERQPWREPSFSKSWRGLGEGDLLPKAEDDEIQKTPSCDALHLSWLLVVFSYKSFDAIMITKENMIFFEGLVV